MKSILCALMSSAGFTLAAEFHVAPDGNDLSGDGSAQKPFATPARAAAALTGRTARGRTQAADVVIHTGTYPIRQTIGIGPAQSGFGQTPVTWRTASDGPVVLSGGVAIPAGTVRKVTDPATLARLPKRESGALQLYEIRLTDLGLDGFPQLNPRGMGRPSSASWPELFHNGQPLPLASWPNGIGYADGFKPVKVIHSAVKKDGEMTFMTEKSRASRWKIGMDQFKSNVWFGGHWYWDWADDLLPAAAIAGDGTVTMGQNHNYGMGTHVNLHVYNLAEEMDVEGEYAIEPAAGRFLVLLNPDQTASLTLTWLQDPFLSLDQAEAVRFNGIEFENTRGTAISIKGGGDISINHCTFQRIGSDAITVNSRHVSVSDCTFSCIGARGVVLNGGDRTTLTRADHLVEYCLFENFSRLTRTYAPAVGISGVGNTVAHSLFRQAPHSAILFSGNEHTIAGNEIHTVLTETGDCGAIYGGRDWTTHGTVITGNWIHDLGGSTGRWANGIYLDDQLSGITVTRNWVDRVELGSMIGGGRHNLIENNIFSRCRQAAISADARGMTWGKARLLPTLKTRLAEIPVTKEPWKSRYPMLAKTMEESPEKPVGTRIIHNAFVACGKPWLNKQDGAGAAVLSPNFENLPENTLIRNGSTITVKDKDLSIFLPTAGPRNAGP